MTEYPVCPDHGPYIDWCDPCVAAAIAALPKDARTFVEAVKPSIETERAMAPIVRKAAPQN